MQHIQAQYHPTIAVNDTKADAPKDAHSPSQEFELLDSHSAGYNSRKTLKRSQSQSSGLISSLLSLPILPSPNLKTSNHFEIKSGKTLSNNFEISPNSPVETQKSVYKFIDSDSASLSEKSVSVSLDTIAPPIAQPTASLPENPKDSSQTDKGMQTDTQAPQIHYVYINHPSNSSASSDFDTYSSASTRSDYSVASSSTTHSSDISGNDAGGPTSSKEKSRIDNDTQTDSAHQGVEKTDQKVEAKNTIHSTSSPLYKLSLKFLVPAKNAWQSVRNYFKKAVKETKDTLEFISRPTVIKKTWAPIKTRLMEFLLEIKAPMDKMFSETIRFFKRPIWNTNQDIGGTSSISVIKKLFPQTKNKVARTYTYKLNNVQKFKKFKNGRKFLANKSKTIPYTQLAAVGLKSIQITKLALQEDFGISGKRKSKTDNDLFIS